MNYLAYTTATYRVSSKILSVLMKHLKVHNRNLLVGNFLFIRIV